MPAIIKNAIKSLLSVSTSFSSVISLSALSLFLFCAVSLPSFANEEEATYVPIVLFEGCQQCLYVKMILDSNHLDPDPKKDKFKYCIGPVGSFSVPEVKGGLPLSKHFSTREDLAPLIEKLKEQDEKLGDEFERLLRSSVISDHKIEAFAKTLLDLLIQLNHASCSQEELQEFMDKEPKAKK